MSLFASRKPEKITKMRKKEDLSGGKKRSGVSKKKGPTTIQRGLLSQQKKNTK